MRLSRIAAIGAISALFACGAEARALLDEPARPASHEDARVEAHAAPARRGVVDLVSKFESWMAAHSKAYHSAEEQLRRMAIFAENALFVEKHNAEHENGEHSHWVGLNRFADLTREEFSELLGYDRSLRAVSGRNAPADALTWEYADVQAPPAKDWVEEGAVTRVKNQGQCGSCWAFSTTGSVEGVNFIKTGKLVSVSEEELVSCSKEGNAGCEGGLMENAMKWIVANGGIDSEDDWPYHAEAGKCGWFARRFRKSVKIDGFVDVPPNDEAALEKAVAMQPVSVAIEADHRSFQLYAGGVYASDDCGTDLDHGVLVVGYGFDEHASGHKHFWKVKNSWGDAWGEDGFIRIAKGGRGKAGQCGVASEPVYPTKKDAYFEGSSDVSFWNGLKDLANDIQMKVGAIGEKGVAVASA
jgi:C1A family cysteine protease